MKAIVSSAMMLTVVWGMTEHAIAQVVPDSTLGTQVTQTGTTFQINNGTRSGNHLFHSFSQFSVPTGGSAIFNNALDIQTIFSRVTGSQLSTIDGILKSQGQANLFLMNPNGIVFGPNAQLQLGGSFLGTTATGIKFADAIEFNTMNATPALLSVNLPIGLQMGTQPGSIQVNGTGHRLVAPSPTFTPYVTTGPIAGLKAQPGKTLALVGGPINLMGGVLTAERGRVELASLDALETASLDAGTSLWKLNTAATQKLSDITLSKQSIVQVSGVGAGSVQVQGRRVSLTEGSLLFSQNRGLAAAGDFRIKADSLDIIGGIANRNIRSAIINETLAGNSGSISVTTRQLNLVDGGSLASRSFGLGSSGDVTINASESVKMAGYLAGNSELISVIGTTSFSPLITGRSGLVTISTPFLSVMKGAIISATTFGNADAGNVNINADRIELIGRSPSSFGPSTISSSTLGNGNAGNVTINTRSMFMNDTGNLNTASSTNGDAGNLMINASESLEVGNRSDITSGAGPSTPSVIAALNLPLRPRGNAGSITINTPLLRVRDQARIIVANTGLGNSGKVSITADRILLDRQAQISAATVLGEGGNVVLKSQALVLRHGSKITATAGGSGNGGNITIDSPIIGGLENSDIVANASTGRGGNIAITTQGILGLKYRTALTPENDITARSEFGISGNVQVNTIGINPTNALNELPSEVVDSSRQITDRCGTAKSSSFIATGRGGIPQAPSQHRRSGRSWNDVRSIAAMNPSVPPLQPIKPLLEANKLHVDPSGTIALVAAQPIALQATATCGTGEPNWQQWK